MAHCPVRPSSCASCHPALACPTSCLPSSLQIHAATRDACMQDERRQLLQQVQQLQAEVEAQQQELAQYAGNDPGRYDAISEY